MRQQIEDECKGKLINGNTRRERNKNREVCQPPRGLNNKEEKKETQGKVGVKFYLILRKV